MVVQTLVWSLEFVSHISSMTPYLLVVSSPCSTHSGLECNLQVYVWKTSASERLKTRINNNVININKLRGVSRNFVPFFNLTLFFQFIKKWNLAKIWEAAAAHLMNHFTFSEFTDVFLFIHNYMATILQFLKIYFLRLVITFFCISGTHNSHCARWLLFLCLLFKCSFPWKKYIMLKKGQTSCKILRCKHCKILKECLATFQHYACRD